jgi:AraC-like DNA-binding protein
VSHGQVSNVHALLDVVFTCALREIATQRGQQDAFSFSKVFKRTVGVSPRVFRQRNAADRSHPWRFAGALGPRLHAPRRRGDPPPTQAPTPR